MRPDALRPRARAAAAKSRTNLATRLTRGEVRHRKRMAEVATVYDIIPAPRTPASVITLPGEHPPRPGPPGPPERGKWLTASVTSHVRPGALQDVLRSRAPRPRPRAALGHAGAGNPHQIRPHHRRSPTPQPPGHHPDRLHPRPRVSVGRRLVLPPRSRPRRRALGRTTPAPSSPSRPATWPPPSATKPPPPPAQRQQTPTAGNRPLPAHQTAQPPLPGRTDRRRPIPPASSSHSAASPSSQDVTSAILPAASHPETTHPHQQRRLPLLLGLSPHPEHQRNSPQPRTSYQLAA